MKSQATLMNDFNLVNFSGRVPWLLGLIFLCSACNAAIVAEMQCSESECIQSLPKEKEVLAKLKLPFEVTAILPQPAMECEPRTSLCLYCINNQTVKLWGKFNSGRPTKVQFSGGSNKTANLYIIPEGQPEPKVRENEEVTLPWKINIPATGLVSLPIVSYVPFVVSSVDVQSLEGVRLHLANKATQLESSCEDVCYHTEKVTADVTFFGKVDFVGQRQVLFVAKNATRFMLVKLNSIGNKVSACNCIGVISVLLLIKSVI